MSRMGARPQSEPLPAFGGVVLGLLAHVAGQQRSRRRVVPRARDAEQILELDFGAYEVRQQARRPLGRLVVGGRELAKSGQEILLSHGKTVAVNPPGAR